MKEQNFLDNPVGVFGHPAAINIKMWTGKDPDKRVMTKAFQEVIG